MKCHHPDVFCAALLNAQPMGFYAPAQIVRDAQQARRRGPAGLASTPATGTARWKPVGALPGGAPRLRGRCGASPICMARRLPSAPRTRCAFRQRRGGLAPRRRAARGDGEAGRGRRLPLRRPQDRREALWKVKGLGEAPLPLFAAADAREQVRSPEGLEPALSPLPLTAGREVVEDYRALQLSLRHHPVSFLRAAAGRAAASSAAPSLATHPRRPQRRCRRRRSWCASGRARREGVLFITAGGRDRHRQRRSSGPTGSRNLTAGRCIAPPSMIAMRGRLQKEGGVIHIICDRITDHDEMLRSIGRTDFTALPARGDGARNGGGPDLA